jgi:RNA polymerase sigma-70 factor (ECF subfamily)
METIEIIRLLKSKDEKALSYLFDNYSGALNGIITRILGSEKLAEEVLQQTFLKIWNKIELYDESKSQLFTWMSRIARNAAIDVKRLKKYENNKNTYSLDLNVHNGQKDHMNLASIDAHSLIAKLDEKHRIILDYIYLNGYSQSETAKELQIPLGTVKTRARRAILDLREILKDEKMLFTGSFTLIIILITFLCL